jgi:hypothetical protein
MKTNITSYLKIGVLVFGSLGWGSFNAHAAGPVSELYLTPNLSTLVGIQGASVLFNVAESPTNGQSAVAVNSTVRAIQDSGFNGWLGGEYSLSTGAPTGDTYPFPSAVSGAVLYDGTMDGTNNYSLDFYTGTVYQFGLDWSGGSPLFTLGTGSGLRMGIIYDPSNNSLWIAGYSGQVGTLISDYSLTGTLLSSFKISHDSNAGLALDPADGTLWVVSLYTSSQLLLLEQYARSATGSFGATQGALNSQTYTGIPNDAYGAEFRYTGSIGGNQNIHPAIAVSLSPNTSSIKLSWPTNAVGFNLMQTTNLLPSAWNLVTNIPEVINTNFTVTLSLKLTNGFFRLQK